jgi:hypothetical protein
MYSRSRRENYELILVVKSEVDCPEFIVKVNNQNLSLQLIATAEKY